VAVSPQGKIIGHVAIFFSKDNPFLAELGTAAVDPDFRGHGCLRRLSEYALAEARWRQLSALYGRPVTSHTYSQKVAADFGFQPCGLQVGLGPAFLSFKKIHEELSQRESMVIIYRSLTPTSPGTIFPPSRHRQIILKLYAALGLTPATAEPDGELSVPGRELGHLNLTAYQSAAFAVIKIKTIGSDTLEALRRQLKHLCQARFEVINLHLDLSQPQAALLAPQCESLGFFFAGIVPGLNGAQTLILQYLNNIPLDYDRIQLHSPLAREILTYVKQADPNRL
jgi:serine/threonine-protein kinase RsbW